MQIHSRKMNLMRGIDLKRIGEKMTGGSGAELKAVCTEAGLLALRERRMKVTHADFKKAKEKVLYKKKEGDPETPEGEEDAGEEAAAEEEYEEEEEDYDEEEEE